MAISAKTTLVALLAGLLAAPAAQGAEIREQPASVQKGHVVRIQWAGGPSEPKVLVRRRHGLTWKTQAREGTAGVVLEDLGEGVWSARWQPSYYSPSGTYRIRVTGADYTLVSDEFRVRPCHCVVPNQLRSTWRGGRYRLQMTAEYVSNPARSLLSLPTVVTTGRPVVRVLRDGHRIGSVLLRYRDGMFRGSWKGRRRPPNAYVFQLVSLADAFGNS
jgi:hypothetical protein